MHVFLLIFVHVWGGQQDAFEMDLLQEANLKRGYYVGPRSEDEMVRTYVSCDSFLWEGSSGEVRERGGWRQRQSGVVLDDFDDIGGLRVEIRFSGRFVAPDAFLFRCVSYQASREEQHVRSRLLSAGRRAGDVIFAAKSLVC